MKECRMGNGFPTVAPDPSQRGKTVIYFPDHAELVYCQHAAANDPWGAGVLGLCQCLKLVVNSY